MDKTKCPCLSGQPYLSCCAPYHHNQAVAPTAEALMRSRYSAFVLQLAGYLHDTHHLSTRPADDESDSLEKAQWLGLTIREVDQHDESATVEFIAFYQDQPIGQLHERSRFIKEQGRWFYLDGQFLSPIKLTRNSACICGSGKKLKRCHG